jgi:hypothetical protein
MADDHRTAGQGHPRWDTGLSTWSHERDFGTNDGGVLEELGEDWMTVQRFANLHPV